MKNKITLIIILGCITSIYSFAQVSQYPTIDNHTINFNLPSYFIADTNLYDEFGINETYSYLKFENVDEAKHYGVIADIGFPALPQQSFLYSIHSDTVHIEIQNPVFSTHYIGNQILPYQEDLKNEFETIEFKKDYDYYENSGHYVVDFINVSSPFTILGQRGVSLHICPFLYNPQEGSLTVLESATISVVPTINKKPSLSIDKPLMYSFSDTRERFLNSVFENYDMPSYTAGSKVVKGRFLVITAPEFLNTMSAFINFKKKQGYQVEIFTTNETGTSASTIKGFIQRKSDTLGAYPDFLLFVGNVSKIPAFGGNPSGEDIDSPLTDFGYTLLNEDKKELPDLFIGRWPCNSLSDLTNIINKTLYMEMQLHTFVKKATFIAGNDTKNIIEKKFKASHNNVIEESFQPQGYSCEKLYGTSKAAALNSLSQNPIFYIYSGHGNRTSWALDIIPPREYLTANEAIGVAGKSIFPFSFSFACLTGNYSDSNHFSNSWINSSKGGVSYFGSSVNTMVQSDVAIEYRLLGDSFKDNGQLGLLINKGMIEYHNRFWSKLNSKRTNRYMKAYNLMGDPSLLIDGVGLMETYTFDYPEVFSSGIFITYLATGNIQNNANFLIQNGATINLKSQESVSLLPGFDVELGGTLEITTK